MLPYQVLEKQIADRKVAEGKIIELLKKLKIPLCVSEIVNLIPMSEEVVRRAVLRLAASARVILDQEMKLVLPAAS